MFGAYDCRSVGDDEEPGNRAGKCRICIDPSVRMQIAVFQTV